MRIKITDKETGESWGGTSEGDLAFFACAFAAKEVRDYRAYGDIDAIAIAAGKPSRLYIIWSCGIYDEITEDYEVSITEEIIYPREQGVEGGGT